jgi:hypothetical protein
MYIRFFFFCREVELAMGQTFSQDILQSVSKNDYFRINSEQETIFRYGQGRNYWIFWRFGKRWFVLNIVQWLMLALSTWPNRVGVSLPSREDGIRSSFRHVVFPSYSEFPTMDKVHKPKDSDSEYNINIVLEIKNMFIFTLAKEGFAYSSCLNINVAY